jgi:hypothetical protein
VIEGNGLKWPEIEGRYRKKYPKDKEATADMLRHAYERVHGIK